VFAQVAVRRIVFTSLKRHSEITAFIKNNDISSARMSSLEWHLKSQSINPLIFRSGELGIR
jgi:hypothetical protein